MSEKNCKEPSAWHDGSCCCNCKHRVFINKHPWNKGEAKGRITQTMGMGCMAFWNDKEAPEKERVIIFQDDLHGMCEMHDPIPAREKWVKEMRDLAKFAI